MGVIGSASLLAVSLITACGDDAGGGRPAAPAPPPVEPATHVVRIGTVAEEPLEEMRTMQPLINYLDRRLHAKGYDFKAAAVPSMARMVELLESGEIDIYMDSPFPVYRVARSVPLRVFLVRWKHGVGRYHSVVFVRADSGLARPQELLGAVIAFEDPFSTGSYALPKAELLQLGLMLEPVEGPSGAVPDKKLGYVFTSDDETTLVWVLAGKVAAGAMNHIDFENLVGRQKNELSVVHTTRSVPRHLVACRTTLDTGVISDVGAALLAAAESEAGRRALEAFENTSRFERLDDEEGLRMSMNELIARLEE